jgi:phage terminase large subunit
VSEPDPDYVFTTAPDRPRQLAHHGRIWTEPRPDKIICDHDAEGRETLAREIGRPTHAANKSVTLGLEAGQSWFKVDGTRADHAALVPGARVQFVRTALVERDQDLVQAMRPTCTVEELPGYVWLDHRTKEEPVKVDDHGCDGYRYLVMDQTRRGGSGVRVM